jgi:hypothetical protein
MRSPRSRTPPLTPSRWAKAQPSKNWHNPEVLCDAPKTYNVTVAKVKGEQALKLIDPRFSIMRGISFSQGF